jgi:Fe2+ or Zn2+ uptake regulation protein
MSLVQTIAAHQRLCILRLLAAAAGYRLPDSLLRGGLDDFGLAASRDQVRALLAWLQEQGLVTQAAPAATAVVATLTERGLDVAEGRAHHPGVHKPSPSALARAALRAAAGLEPEE